MFFSKIKRSRIYSGTFIEYTMMTSSNAEELSFHKSLCEFVKKKSGSVFNTLVKYKK